MNAAVEKALDCVRHMNRLTLFGLVAVSLMLLFYTLENRSSAFVLAFAGACAMGSIYGFLIPDAWPFGVVEGVWSLVALRRWWIGRQVSRSRKKKLEPISVEDIL
jgi:hypothetical protein